MTSLAVLMLAPFSCRLGKQCQYDAMGMPMHRNIENTIDCTAVQASSDAIFAPKKNQKDR
jgi:hypothetical protein